MSNVSVRLGPKLIATTDDLAARDVPKIWHTLQASEVASDLGANSQAGLSNQQVLDRQARYGPNQLAESPPTPSWMRFLGQFAELIIWILIVAALIAGALGEWLDATAILAIVFLMQSTHRKSNMRISR